MTPAQAHSKGDRPPQEVSWGGSGGQEEDAGVGALGTEMIEARKERCHLHSFREVRRELAW